ncbi:hypothetical protein KIPB_005540 [Kipferlia bialata]|uniref:Uncharacterized protein n=1 Tax=Kipferlia bialata TaxID=797122 RepID=A0A391NLB1_9EUKA|nr:hypothetical protein KIPB_005540 [Kipferlia bialata]|eukprot:g5540.t1
MVPIDRRYIAVESSDGQRFFVPVAVAVVCETLRSQIRFHGDVSIIEASSQSSTPTAAMSPDTVSEFLSDSPWIGH